MPAMMKWHVAIPIAPVMRTGLRPSLSTYMTAGIYRGQHARPLRTGSASLVTYSGHKHGNAHYAGREKGDSIAAHPELLEDGWGIVEHGINTRPLLLDVSMWRTSADVGKYSNLERHSHCSDHYTTEHGLAFKQARKAGSLELDITPSVRPLQMGKVELLGTLVEQTLGLDLEEFQLNQGIITGKTTEIGEHRERFVLTIMMCEPTRRERHEYHPNSEDDGWSYLQCKRNKPGCVTLSITRSPNVVGAVIDPSKKMSMLPNRRKPHEFTRRKPICLLVEDTLDSHIKEYELTMIPKVIANCCRPTREPLISGGAIW